MSLIAYEVLTVQPDFSEVPQIGIEDDRDLVQSPGGRAFAAWADRTDRVARFAFQTHTAEEWRILREFFDRLGGRAVAFYLPSWQHDFELAEAAEPGSLNLKLAGHWYVDNVTENRPDTLGRVIFTLNHLGQFSAHLVTSFGEDGADDVVGLQDPITNPLEAGRTMVGFCYLARLTDDTVDSEHLSVDHARMVVGFRNITHTRRVTQRESALGQLFGTMKANEDIVATDEDPIFYNPRTYEAVGPFVLNAPQTENFQSPWVASMDIESNTVRVVGQDYEYTSAIYNAPGPAEKIALAFDAASQEVLAWEKDGRVWIGWTTGSGIQRINFNGISPVAYNTFAIDSTVNAGTATLAIFYLKPQDATIYCRIMAESFATERRFCVSPLAPLRLFTARRNEGRIDLVGIDTGHRRARWRSQTYLTPLEIQIVLAEVQELSGLYRAVTVFSRPEDALAAAIVPLAGEYRATRIQSLGNNAGGADGRVVGELSGTYVTVRITRAVAEPGALGLVVPTTGTYTLVRKLGIVTEPGINAKPEPLTGTYAP